MKYEKIHTVNIAIILKGYGVDKEGLPQEIIDYFKQAIIHNGLTEEEG